MVGIGWFLAIILGAVVGNFLLTAIVGATLYGIIGQMIVAVLGACLLIAIVRGLRRA